MQFQFICVLRADQLQGINRLFVKRQIKQLQVIRHRHSPIDEALPVSLVELDLGNSPRHMGCS